ITDAGLVYLAGMKNLQVLVLGKTRITDAGLVHLAGMKNLQELDLWRTQITDAGLEKLRKALPGCEIIK
ncbi:MAG TPA: leucine-rich repeat domain-containing protein, partial [Thermoguttaceae bacterium]|nr:leucine-rich repeat domain-containing protein [Thermoguttaceae bacterium]